MIEKLEKLLGYKFTWNRKDVIKKRGKYFRPVCIFSAIFYLVLLYKIILIDYLFLVIGLCGLLMGILDLFYNIPSTYIGKDNESKEYQKGSRLLKFFVGIVVFYILTIDVLSKYYPYFKQFPVP